MIDRKWCGSNQEWIKSNRVKALISRAFSIRLFLILDILRRSGIIQICETNFVSYVYNPSDLTRIVFLHKHIYEMSVVNLSQGDWVLFLKITRDRLPNWECYWCWTIQPLLSVHLFKIIITKALTFIRRKWKNEWKRRQRRVRS